MENSKVISRADELKARAESAVEQAKDLSQSSINYAKEIIKLFGEAGGDTSTLNKKIDQIEEDFLYQKLGLDGRGKSRPKKTR